MRPWRIRQTVRLEKCGARIGETRPDDLILPGDSSGHIWEVTVLEDGAPADLSDGSVSAYFMRADGKTVVQRGVIAGNVCKVALSAECCAISGPLRAAMRLTSASAAMTLADCLFQVRGALGDDFINGGGAVPSLDTLLGQITRLEAGLDRLDGYTLIELDDTLTQADKAADARATGDAIAPLRAPYGRNLYNAETNLTGKWIDASGNLLDGEMYDLSQFIPLASTRVTITNVEHSGTATHRVAVYDEEQNFLRREVSASPSLTLAVSPGQYLRLTVQNKRNSAGEMRRIMVEEGGAYTAYADYYTACDQIARGAVQTLRDITEAVRAREFRFELGGWIYPTLEQTENAIRMRSAQRLPFRKGEVLST
ncbi:MAG: hypothetical protein IJ074_01810, partial [Clostridia bacterium]|nr:hypothetical protein [Clostridia bacterium]